MRLWLAFAFLLAAAVGCCGPAYSTCPPASASPCGHRVDVMLDGSRHLYRGYGGGLWVETPPASLRAP